MTVLREHLPDLDALALFIAVDEMGSFGKAARRFGMSQSAASQRVRALERELDVVLLNRHSTGSSLTAIGRVVAEWAALLVESGGQFARNVGTLAEHRHHQLRAAASLTVSDYLIPAWLIELHAALPDVAVSLQPANSERVVEMVVASSVELGFVEGPHAPERVGSRVLSRDNLTLILAPTHRWAHRDSITATELCESPLVLREPGSGTRQVLDRALESHHLTAHPTMELGSTTAIKQAIADGEHSSVLSQLSVADDVKAGVFVSVPIPELNLSRRIRAIWPIGRPPTGPAGALLSIASKNRKGSS